MLEICFVHVPKTGGHSLLLDSVAVLGAVEIAIEGPNFTTYRVITRPDLTLTYIGHNARVNNYMTIARYKKHHPDCFAFGFARNPYDRLVSAFHYLNKGGMNIWDRRDGKEYLGAYQGDFRQFVRDAFSGPEPPRIFQQMHLRPQVDWLCDETGQIMVDCLGHFESIPSTYEELGRRIGIVLPEPSHVNKSQHSRYETYYDETARSLVEHAYRADFERLGYQPDRSLTCKPFGGMRTMNVSERGAGRFPAMQRKAVRISAGAVVRYSYLDENKHFPLVIEPAVDGVNLAGWAEANREQLEARLLQHGAILFRNFNVDSAVHLDKFIQATCGQPLEYQERSSPRSQVSGNIYTSTDHPPNESIFLHNEQSYNLTFPLRILFFCTQPAQQGGATPIADTRKIFNRISARTRERFIEKKYMYTRNFGDGFGLSWQTAFQTTDKSAVETYCRRNDITWEWKSNERLRTQQVRRAVAYHPRTGEPAWFNHLTFFHFSTLEPAVRETLLSMFSEEDLPNNTYYGDGSRIEPEVLDELRAAYHQETVSFPWQKGDILMLDNMLSSHGREPYSGPRQVLVGMAEPYNWELIPTHN